MSIKWESIEGEVWKPTRVLGYEVSNMGRVRIFRLKTSCSKPSLCGRPHLLRPSRTARYLRVELAGKPYQLHHLVLEAFVCPKPNGLYGCHINGKAHDNRLSNLKWDTPKNNNADKIKHDTAGHKLRNEDVAAIREEYARGNVTQKFLSEKYGVHKHYIWSILSWRRRCGNR